MNGPDRSLLRSLLLTRLLASPATADAANDPNRPLLASIVAGQAQGLSALPPDLGLGAARHAAMLDHYFPACELPEKTVSAPAPALPEFEELQKLLLDHRAGERDSELLVADIVTTACIGMDHLWQDLGFASRDELNKLIWVNFPALARANTGDMKWKKFLYRQFCAREGIYVCPAPSCGVCADHAKCFGPEN